MTQQRASSERVCLLYRLNTGAQSEYTERHQKVWPEMYSLLAEAGISNYSIFLRGQTLVSVLEAEPTWRAALGVLQGSDVQREWSQSLEHLFARVRDSSGEFLYADEVFRFDGLVKARGQGMPRGPGAERNG